MKWLTDHGLSPLDWLGNSPDLNPKEDAWAKRKHDLEDKDRSSVPCLMEALQRLCIAMDPEYFKNLAKRMPSRLQKAIKAHGHMTEC